MTLSSLILQLLFEVVLTASAGLDWTWQTSQLLFDEAWSVCSVLNTNAFLQSADLSHHYLDCTGFKQLGSQFPLDYLASVVLSRTMFEFLLYCWTNRHSWSLAAAVLLAQSRLQKTLECTASSVRPLAAQGRLNCSLKLLRELSHPKPVFCSLNFWISQFVCPARALLRSGFTLTALSACLPAPFIANWPRTSPYTHLPASPASPAKFRFDGFAASRGWIGRTTASTRERGFLHYCGETTVAPSFLLRSDQVGFLRGKTWTICFQLVKLGDFSFASFWLSSLTSLFQALCCPHWVCVSKKLSSPCQIWWRFKARLLKRINH